MLEDIDRLRRQPALIEQFGLHQPGQRLLQCRLVQWRHRPQQLVRKLPSQDRPELRHLFHHRQSIEPGHQDILQRGRNRQGRQRASQHIAAGVFLHETRFQDGLHQLFHKKRDAIGFGHDLGQHLGGYRLPTGHPHDHLLALVAREARQGELRHIGPGRPGWVKLWSGSQHQQQAGRGDMVQHRSSSSRVDGSAQCRSSHTASTGCRAVSASSHATSASCVFCFWRWGESARDGYCSGTGSERRAANSGTTSARGRPTVRSACSSVASRASGVSSRCHCRSRWRCSITG